MFTAIDRIAIFLPTLHAGGAERMALDLAGHWAREGREVDLVCVSAIGPMKEQVPRGVRLVDLGASRVAASALRAAAYLRRNPERPCWSFLSHMNTVVLAAGRVLTSHPSAIAIQEVSRFRIGRDLAIPIRRRAVEVAVRALYRRADIVAAVSPDVADDIARHAGIRRGQIAILPNAVDSAALRRAAAEPFDHPFLADRETPLLVSVARLAPEKDHETLIRAFALARKVRPLRLLILGDGPLRSRLTGLAAEQGVAGEVDFLGYEQNPWRVMARADLLVLHSLAEGFGLVLVEAMTCGTDVISTDCGLGPRRILADARFGPMPPVRDPPALAAGILQKLESPTDPAVLGYVAEAFDIHDRARTFIEMIARAQEARYRSCPSPHPLQGARSR